MTRLLVLIGSGETSPSAVTLHQELLRTCGSHPVLVETPYGFQENVDEVSGKARRYFARSVGTQAEVAPGMRAPADDRGVDLDHGIAALRSEAWTLAGPGSPTYAARQWLGSAVAQILRERLRREGVTVFSSAAACVTGQVGLPVYEIYKAGVRPAWIDGIDVLGDVGIHAAVVPHYDNTEGGTHDTRYCYMGERRMRALERQLPPDVAILGIDEHTALILDLARETLTVRGRGRFTVRRAGLEKHLGAGARIGLGELRGMLAGRWTAEAGESAPGPCPETAEHESPTLEDVARRCERRFEAAEPAGDADGMIRAILDLYSGMSAWSTDTDVDSAEMADALLRSMVVRLGRAVSAGGGDPRARLAPLVEPLLAMRERLRVQHAWDLADELRDALAAGGIEVGDTPRGTRWGVAGRVRKTTI